MEYINYILASLAIGLLCLLAIKLNSTNAKSRVMLDYATRQRIRQTAATTKIQAVNPATYSLVKSPGTDGNSRATFKRGAHRAGAPWGWPGHQKLKGGNAARPGASGRLHSFMNRLVRQRELLSSNSNNPRTSGSVRALLEDRYGCISKGDKEFTDYHRVKRPLLRNPNELHDQMTGFDSGESEQLDMKIMNVASMSRYRDSRVRNPDFRFRDIEDVKQPWGW